MAITKLLKKRESLALRDDGSLRIVIVADSHSEPHPKCAKYIAEAKPDRILHAGDIGSLKVLDGLAKIAPVSAVRGNIDVHAPEVPDWLTLSICDRPSGGSGGSEGSEASEEERSEDDNTLFKILLLHIAVNGPRLRADAIRAATAEAASIVVCGHSHIPFIGRDKKLTVFNPGSIGPRRFHLPIVFGVMDITSDPSIVGARTAPNPPINVKMKHVSCETGEQWLP